MKQRKRMDRTGQSNKKRREEVVNENLNSKYFKTGQ